MSGSDPPPSVPRLRSLVEAGDHAAAAACLERIEGADAATRKSALRALGRLAEDRATALCDLAPAVESFLTDDARAVRLTTAKLFVSLAKRQPGTVRPAVPSLADRLADDEEFYYVRGRAAEALGYVALDYPDAVGTPEILADLRVGLSFEEPEVREKLAKALASVALGDPDRLCHRVPDLAEHLDDGTDLVRYHLATALVAVGCERPAALADASDALIERLTDGNPYVRGRAAEALGLLARERPGAVPTRAVASVSDSDVPFASRRGEFAARASEGDGAATPPDGVGAVEAVRETTDDVVEEMTTPDGAECPHCGLAFDGPPPCPRCGAPL